MQATIIEQKRVARVGAFNVKLIIDSHLYV